MLDILQVFILLPLFAFLMIALVPKSSEKLIAYLSLGTIAMQLLGVLIFSMFWIKSGMQTLTMEHLTLYENGSFTFGIHYQFDLTTCVFALVGSTLSLLVVQFSRFYMHRDGGYKRFFCTMMIFFLGYQLVIFSGNFETLFLGWEMIGISSFLLIAYYRERYLPVRNAFKVLSFYRLGDVFLVLTMWLSHHLFHRNIRFIEWANTDLTTELAQHSGMYIAMAVCLIMSALIKSAQFPFSTWLPTAMEGPTSSSALFYGGLAAHIGAFLLLRTYPFWSELTVIIAILIVIGLITAITAHLTAKVQATVKTQIAYASITQIGLIFIEIALGWHVLALWHFAGNAFLRSYQLLVSPSVLSYLGHHMFFHFSGRKLLDDAMWKNNKLTSAFFVLAMKEWNMHQALLQLFWRPLKKIGSALSSLGTKPGLVLTTALCVIAIVTLAFQPQLESIRRFLPAVMAGIAVALVLQVLADQGSALRAWLQLSLAQVFMAVSILWYKQMPWSEIALYLGGTLIATLVGLVCIMYMNKREGHQQLNQYHGHVYEYPKLALVFLLACLSFSGFPITPSFIGVDLMFSHIEADQWILIGLWAIQFLCIELALIRIYLRVFLGMHIKENHPIAFKWS
jgi:NADH-quinone oxidoreductase subunit L